MRYNVRQNIIVTFSVKEITKLQGLQKKLLQQGVDALSNLELLALLIADDDASTALEAAQRCLMAFDGLSGLAEVDAEALRAAVALDEAALARTLAGMALGKRLMIAQRRARPVIKSAADAAQLMSDMAHLPQEHVRLILLDNDRRVIATPTIYIGTVNVSVLRVAEIYREAVVRNSPAVILIHNHPSGDPTPSPEDIQLTRTLLSAGRLLDIVFVDHIIIGQRRWVSLKEMGLGF